MGYGDQIFILDFVKFTLGKLVGERTILTLNDDNNQLERAHVPRDERGDFIFVSFDAESPTAQYTGYGNGLAHVTELALKIFEEIESPYATKAREQLEEWRTG